MGECVCAPGYDPATRGKSQAVTYDPSGHSVIVLEGSFSGHRSIRDIIDFLLFAEVPKELQRARFATFYRWKGYDERSIEALWQARSSDEWAAVDVQRDSADSIISMGASR
jgi:hypothetical protein